MEHQAQGVTKRGRLFGLTNNALGGHKEMSSIWADQYRPRRAQRDVVYLG
jgi:hypothetical protein